MGLYDRKIPGLGLAYEQYLRSNEWADVRKRYNASAFTQGCLVCGDSNFQLHHRTYTRLGYEELTDLVPLCRKHHDELHGYANEHGISLQDTHDILRKLHGWTTEETEAKFLPWKLDGRPNGFELTPFGGFKKRKRPSRPRPKKVRPEELIAGEINAALGKIHEFVPKGYRIGMKSRFGEYKDGECPFVTNAFILGMSGLYEKFNVDPGDIGGSIVSALQTIRTQEDKKNRKIAAAVRRSRAATPRVQSAGVSPSIQG